MTALQGIERGFYTLRTPVAELVPEFAAEGKDKVTVGHLLNPHRWVERRTVPGAGSNPGRPFRGGRGRMPRDPERTAR